MDIKIIVDLQKRILKLMEKYEAVTKKLLDCETDEILILTEKRKNVWAETSKLDERIKRECGENTQVLAAYKNECERGSLPDELTEIFDLRQQLNAILFRIKTLDPEITERIAMIRDNLVVKIKKNNSGQNAKAAKYATAANPSGKKMFFPENKKMI